MSKSGWGNIAHSMTNVIRVMRATIVTNPNARITIVVENVKENSQFEISETSSAEETIASLRRCADRLEKENRAGTVALSGVALSTTNPNEEPSIIERPMKRRD